MSPSALARLAALALLDREPAGGCGTEPAVLSAEAEEGGLGEWADSVLVEDGDGDRFRLVVVPLP